MKKFNVTVDGKTYAVEVNEVSGAATYAAAPAPVAAPAPAPAPAPAAAPAAPVAAGATTVTAPMNGTIAKINCKVGDTVSADDAVIILEAMKMENEIFAGVSGTVSEVRTSVGTAVQPGDVLVVIG